MNSRESQPDSRPPTGGVVRFPPDFLWGAATSAYQIEGSPLADGAGPSNWHRFAHTPGRIHRDQTGDIACDHYRRWPADVDLMNRLGLNAYRFSLSWSRILPAGTGQVNQPGLDFYAHLTDELLAHDIQPCITLYHWDLPAALDDRGGWVNPDIAGWFAEYAQVVFRSLADRVRLWVTLNEPWVVMDAGYVHGVHAPGHRDLSEAVHVSHNLLRAHGAAVQAYRAEGSHQIGLVVNLEPKYAASDAPEERAATARADAYMNRQYLDPVYLGRYPEELKEVCGDAWSEFPADDFALIQEPTDFLGINYYTRAVVCDDATVVPDRAGRVRQPDSIYTATDWEVHPESLTKILLWVRQRYGDIPLYITENGAAFPDPDTTPGDHVADPLRTEYFRQHLLAVHEAMRQGVDLRGYFAWSLLDNFEWAHGFSKRFGLVHVDYTTQQRTWKASAHYYCDVIRTQGKVLSQS